MIRWFPLAAAGASAMRVTVSTLRVKPETSTQGRDGHTGCRHRFRKCAETVAGFGRTRVPMWDDGPSLSGRPGRISDFGRS
jgi:hypothetical protein